jgi:aquaporin Z|tara:strand:- start:1615 stop:2133 length:519 start_codon:yes stop_codon:yes gene_type:complete
MKKYIVEFICTFFLVFIIGSTVIDPSIGAFAPIAIGFGLVILVYAGGHISGAHYNPAVTIAVWLRGACDKKDVIPYIVAQVAAAALAAFSIILLKPAMAGATPVLATVPVLVVEVLFTFLLAYVILTSQPPKRQRVTPTLDSRSAEHSWWAFSPAVQSRAVSSILPLLWRRA